MKKKDELKSDLQKQLYSKYNSYLLKEKLFMNEKIIFEHYYSREVKDFEGNQAFKRFMIENSNKALFLDLVQKNEVVKAELENANIKWDKFEKKKDSLTDELLAKNQEIIQNIKDIKMEVYDLNRKIDIQSDNPKSGKILADVFYKFFESKFTKNRNLINKLIQQNETLEKQIKKEEEKLKDKDKSQELKFIDFYQLQIENKKYMKEVDEKNKMLLKLKMTIGKIGQDKNKYKNQLDDKIKDLDTTKDKTKRQIKEFEKIEGVLYTQQQKENDIANKTKSLGTKQNQLRKKISIEDHIKEKNIESELFKILKNLEKKLNIEEIQKSTKDSKERLSKVSADRIQMPYI